MMKFLFIIASVASLLGAIKADTVEAANLPNQPPRRFLFGADIDPKAPDLIKALFFETGLNCARMTGGGYGWSVAMHTKLADDFEKRGLLVYMQLGSHYPDGSYLGLKDASLVDQKGVPGIADKQAWAMSYSGQNWPQYSYTSQPFREKLVGDFTAYVKNFSGNHNIAGVILHNEPGFFWLSDRLFDYNPTTVDAFHRWLGQQYGSITALNERWGTSYASFADVVPPGKPPVANLAAWMDWRHFSVGSVAEFLHWESDFFKTLRSDIPRTTNLDGPLNNWYGYRCANLFQYSAPMDRVGMDIYPSRYTSRAFVPYSVDMMQGVAQGRQTNVMECDVFSTRQWPNLDENPRAGLLYSELWTMIGHGLDGVFLWGFSHAENDFSLTDGTFNPRVQACRNVVHDFHQMGLENFHRRPSRVALCIDPDSYLHDNAVEPKALDLTTHLDEETQGFHAALADAGIQSDVIFTDQLRTGAAKKYDAILLPAAMMMDESLAGLLKDYVSDGGTLIASAPFAQMDRWGKPAAKVPAFGLDEVFGLTVSAGAQASDEITSGQGKIAAGERDGTVQTNDAQAVGTYKDGSPALTVHPFGRGRAIFLSSTVGEAYMENWGGKSLSATLANLLQQASISPEIEVQSDQPLDNSSLVDRQGNVLFVLSAQQIRGKPPVPAHNITVTYPTDDPMSYREAFTFPATTTDAGLVSNGPVRLDTNPGPDGKNLSFNVAEIDSALPILLLRNAGPLLAIEARSIIDKGSEGDATVTLFNPSSVALQGTLELQSASSIPLQGGSADISVPAFSQGKALLHFKLDANASPARIPLEAVLTPTNSAGKIVSVPIDVEMK